VNLPGPVFALLITAVFGGGGLTIAVLNALVGKGGRRADVAAHITEANDKLLARFERELDEFDDMKERCKRCETKQFLTEGRLAESERRERRLEDEMKELKAAMRVTVRAVATKDHEAVAAAISSVKNLIG
jgi:hypothetical protein